MKFRSLSFAAFARPSELAVSVCGVMRAVSERGARAAAACEAVDEPRPRPAEVRRAVDACTRRRSRPPAAPSKPGLRARASAGRARVRATSNPQHAITSTSGAASRTASHVTAARRPRRRGRRDRCRPASVDELRDPSGRCGTADRAPRAARSAGAARTGASARARVATRASSACDDARRARSGTPSAAATWPMPPSTSSRHVGSRFTTRDGPGSAQRPRAPRRRRRRRRRTASA